MDEPPGIMSQRDFDHDCSVLLYNLVALKAIADRHGYSFSDGFLEELKNIG